MKKIGPLLTAKGIHVTDLTKPGWTPTEANILALAESIRKLPPDFNQPVILDVLGNVTYRYEQLDGTMAMPYKVGGKFHLEGKVCVCGNSILAELINRFLTPSQKSAAFCFSSHLCRVICLTVAAPKRSTALEWTPMNTSRLSSMTSSHCAQSAKMYF
jgi:hypothetical protein